MHGVWPIFLLIVLAVAGFWASFTFFSGDARLRRRRRKNHSRLVSKSDHPIVRFSVKPPKQR